MSRISTVCMLSKNIPATVTTVGLLAVLGSMALAQQDKYTVQVPNGLAFSDFRDTKIGRSFQRLRQMIC
jgi:hypothetical protein